eukprot:1714087-Karenia_brevis.AAC.1
MKEFEAMKESEGYSNHLLTLKVGKPPSAGAVAEYDRWIHREALPPPVRHSVHILSGDGHEK